MERTLTRYGLTCPQCGRLLKDDGTRLICESDVCAEIGGTAYEEPLSPIRQYGDPIPPSPIPDTISLALAEFVTTFDFHEVERMGARIDKLFRMGISVQYRRGHGFAHIRYPEGFDEIVATAPDDAGWTGWSRESRRGIRNWLRSHGFKRDDHTRQRDP